MKLRFTASAAVTGLLAASLALPGAALAGGGQAGDPVAPVTGLQVFERWCAGCHGRLDEHTRMLAGTYALEQRYKGAKPAALEDRTDLTPELVRFMVRNGLNVMPASRKTEISDAQLGQLVQYLTRKGK